MPLSRHVTVDAFIMKALRDLGLNVNCGSYAERFELTHDAIKTMVTLCSDLLAYAYMTPITIVPDTTGRYSTAPGTWTLATRRLTIAMNTNFGTGDVGKYLTFRNGALVYTGQVEAFIGVGAVQVVGQNLPVADAAIDSAMLASTTPVGNIQWIGDVAFMRTGREMNLVLESTVTDNVDPVPIETLQMWPVDAEKNLKRIAWALVGDYIYMRKGNSLDTYGTFTLKYPRFPVKPTTDTEFIDCVDGAAAELAGLHLQGIIARREARPIPDNMGKMTAMIQLMTGAFGRSLPLEEIKQRALALH